MKPKHVNKTYRCIIFLQNEADKALLAAGAHLYGQIIESTATIFMTPYPPPGRLFPWIGIVQKRHGTENKQSLLINVEIKEKSLVASGFIDNRCIKLPVEIIYAATCYKRTPFNKAEMQLLWKKRVLVFGAGTGGIRICLEFARAGVGTITICDPDRLDYPNISRHEGNLLDVGKPKVHIAAERIYGINPAIKVITYSEDIFERSLADVEAILGEQDLIVAATDKTGVQLQINEIAHQMGIAAVFGGCYEEARGGEVFFTLPERNTPCLACLRGGQKQPERNNHIDYSTARSSDDYQGQPGLHAAIDFITCVEILICLGILLRDSETSQLGKLIKSVPNFILVGGALADGFYRFRKPFDIFFQTLSGPRKTCLVCQNYKQMSDNCAVIVINKDM